MDYKDELEASHQHSLSKLEKYMQEKKSVSPDAHKNVHELKDEWKVAWNKMMEALLVLEKLEI